LRWPPPSPPSVPAAAQDAKPGDQKAGEIKASMCIGCHNIPGYQASFPEIYKVRRSPARARSTSASALTAYRKGDRKHPTMRSIAITLNDQDIADVAAFYEGLGKEAQRRPRPT
jgi:cytochrome c553